MIGIYNDNIIKYLKDNLGGDVNINSRNIICKCPFCDINRVTSKNHLWISLEMPIFNCFRAGCNNSGSLKKLFKKINGHDTSNEYIDRDLLNKNNNIIINNSDRKNFKNNIKIPTLYSDQFPNKKLYLNKRFKFSNINLNSIDGLVFDFIEFINQNNIPLDFKIERMKDYFQNNFIGFLTQNRNIMIMRNIDFKSKFRYYKLQLKKSEFIDYYKIKGGNEKSNHVVLSEGIFDIWPVSLFDLMGFNNQVKLYSSVLSSKFSSLIKSIAFHEDIYRMNISILSDDNVDLNYYKKIKKYNNYLIESLTIYYNKNGKDFNDTPIIPVKLII
jgi:hypothetical protein